MLRGREERRLERVDALVCRLVGSNGVHADLMLRCGARQGGLRLRTAGGRPATAATAPTEGRWGGGRQQILHARPGCGCIRGRSRALLRTHGSAVHTRGRARPVLNHLHQAGAVTGGEGDDEEEGRSAHVHLLLAYALVPLH